MSEYDEKDIIVYAPVVIPTLSRYECFKKCIESLECNYLAKDTELYIGIDYPPNSQYVEGNSRILDYVKEIAGFKKVNVIIHKENVGSLGNYAILVKEVAQKYDRFITVEDDVQVSRNYLEYVNRVLEYYKDDDDFIAVAGHTLPTHKPQNDATIYRSYTYSSGMSLGRFVSTYYNIREELDKEELKAYYMDRKFMSRLIKQSPNQYCNFVKGMLGYTKPDLVNAPVIDITTGIYMAYNTKYVVYPQINKCRNLGYENGGEHCARIVFDAKKEVNHRNIDYSTELTDKAERFTELVESTNTKEFVDREYDSFFGIPKSELNKTKIAYILSGIMGLCTVRRLFKLFVYRIT